MTPEQLVSLFTQGGAIAVLVVGFALAVSGRIVFRQSADARDALWRERLADTVTDRDEWKAVAKAAVPAVERLAEALEARNKRDERVARRGDP